jgi:hypothetical protein
MRKIIVRLRNRDESVRQDCGRFCVSGGEIEAEISGRIDVNRIEREKVKTSEGTRWQR